MAEQSFETLKVWQKSHALMLDIHKHLLPHLPRNVRFCYHARGSLDETLNHLIVARDLEFCSPELYQNLREQVEEIRKLLNGYISWLKTKKVGGNEPGVKLAVQEIPVGYLLDDEP